MTLASSVQPRALGLARYRGEFPIFGGRVYLNTCALGALGERSRRKVAEFLDQWQSRGASAWYDVWWEALSDLRARYGRIINAAPGEIALAPSISVALSAVAESLDYNRRPKVVITSLDFPTVAYQWLAKAVSGVELVVVESPDRISVPVDAIARAIDDRTALVVTSHVYFTSGAIQDIKRVAAAAHAHGALCLIDAYQSGGDRGVDGGSDRHGARRRLQAESCRRAGAALGHRDDSHARSGGVRASPRGGRRDRGQPARPRQVLALLL